MVVFKLLSGVVVSIVSGGVSMCDGVDDMVIGNISGLDVLVNDFVLVEGLKAVSQAALQSLESVVRWKVATVLATLQIKFYGIIVAY